MPQPRRVRRDSAAPSPAAVPRIEELMQSISNLQRVAEEANTARVAEEAELLALMKATGLVAHDVGDLHAEVARSPGRSTNSIDPVAFRKLCPDDKSFFYAVTVSVTKAKEVVAARTLQKIIQTKEAVPGPEHVIVKHVGAHGPRKRS